MLPLRDIMTTDVVTVTPETSIREALELLGHRHVSGAPVVDGSGLVGIVTASDLMTFAAALPGVPMEREDDDDFDPMPERSLADDIDEENEPGSSFYSEMWDDAGPDVTIRLSNVRGPGWNMLEAHDVSEVMTRTPLLTLPPNATATEAAQLMSTHRVHRVLVTEHNKLVGVVSALDIARLAADGKLTTRTFVFK